MAVPETRPPAPVDSRSCILLLHKWLRSTSVRERRARRCVSREMTEHLQQPVSGIAPRRLQAAGNVIAMTGVNLDNGLCMSPPRGRDYPMEVQDR